MEYITADTGLLMGTRIPQTASQHDDQPTIQEILCTPSAFANIKNCLDL